MVKQLRPLQILTISSFLVNEILAKGRGGGRGRGNTKSSFFSTYRLVLYQTFLGMMRRIIDAGFTGTDAVKEKKRISDF